MFKLGKVLLFLSGFIAVVGFNTAEVNAAAVNKSVTVDNDTEYPRILTLKNRDMVVIPPNSRHDIPFVGDTISFKFPYIIETFGFQSRGICDVEAPSGETIKISRMINRDVSGLFSAQSAGGQGSKAKPSAAAGKPASPKPSAAAKPSAVDEDCMICLEKKTGQLSALKCAHTFHKKCIDKWKQQSPKCPLCNQ